MTPSLNDLIAPMLEKAGWTYKGQRPQPGLDLPVCHCWEKPTRSLRVVDEEEAGVRIVDYKPISKWRQYWYRIWYRTTWTLQCSAQREYTDFPSSDPDFFAKLEEAIK